MQHLIAIDPGTITGWALFLEGRLEVCGWTNPARWTTLVDVAGCDIPRGITRNVVIEEPTIYPHSKADPNDIMKLQLKVGQLKNIFESRGFSVTLVQPRTWKRQVKKKVHHPRILKRLEPAEYIIARDQRHDVLDAVGLGLWKLGRYVP